MDEQEIIIYALNLIITVLGYLGLPIILKLCKKQYPKKEARDIAILNSVIVYIIFSIIIFITQDGKIANIFVAIFWGGIGYSIIKDKEIDETIKCEDESDVNELIDTLEKGNKDTPHTKNIKADSTKSEILDTDNQEQKIFNIESEEKTTPNYCDNCGNKLLKDDRFCANCGKEIN